jgi:hypothetical protein
MTTIATSLPSEAERPLELHVQPALTDRNRLTTLFRLVLAIPHLILVGGPAAGALTWGWRGDAARNPGWTANGGVIGAVAIIAAFIAWFAIVFTGRHPEGLWDLAAFYLRWRVRAMAYVSLLRDEYPPFGDGAYPAELIMRRPSAKRDRVSVVFRLILAIPQLVVLWAVSVAWVITTIVAWFAILFTGSYPTTLYEFGVGALRWNIRVEAYLLLLHDEYPPFSLT